MKKTLYTRGKYNQSVEECKIRISEFEYYPKHQTIRLVKWKKVYLQEVDLIYLPKNVIIVLMKQLIIFHNAKP